MRANYHTHTYRCGHAEGHEREYVLRAVEAGLEILGISDHTPYDFFDDEPRDRPMRMKPEELSEYTASVRALAEEFHGKIEILTGVEAEYYPKYFLRLLDMLRENGVRYMILGQHFLGNEIGDVYSGRAFDDVRTLERYVAQTTEALHTGLFTYLAHPDLIHFTGDRLLYEQEMRRLCRNANELAIPLEINMLGIGTHRNYPDPLFWRIAGEEGCTAVIGSDAHAPERILIPEVLARAEELIETNRLKRIDPEELLHSSGPRLKEMNRTYE